MSKYTTELRFICEMKSGLSENELLMATIDEIIDKCTPNIFNFAYPIPDNHKADFERKFLKHYYTREIAHETYGLWNFKLNVRLNELMPKYSKLYQIADMDLEKWLSNIDVKTDMLRTDDMHEEVDGTRSDDLTKTTTNTRANDLTTISSNTSDSKDAFSDTPQGTIGNASLQGDSQYLTDYRHIMGDNEGRIDETGSITDNGSVHDTGTQTTNTTKDNTGTVDTKIHEHGYRGSKTYLELMTEYAERILNIDLMLINELSPLFFGLW